MRAEDGDEAQLRGRVPCERMAEIPVECLRLVKMSATTPVRFWQVPKGVNLRGGSFLQGLGVDAVFAATGGEFVFDQIDQGNERN